MFFKNGTVERQRAFLVAPKVTPAQELRRAVLDGCLIYRPEGGQAPGITRAYGHHQNARAEQFLRGAAV